MHPSKLASGYTGFGCIGRGSRDGGRGRRGRGARRGLVLSVPAIGLLRTCPPFQLIQHVIDVRKAEGLAILEKAVNGGTQPLEAERHEEPRHDGPDVKKEGRERNPQAFWAPANEGKHGMERSCTRDDVCKGHFNRRLCRAYHGLICCCKTESTPTAKNSRVAFFFSSIITPFRDYL